MYMFIATWKNAFSFAPTCTCFNETSTKIIMVYREIFIRVLFLPLSPSLSAGFKAGQISFSSQIKSLLTQPHLGKYNKWRSCKFRTAKKTRGKNNPVQTRTYLRSLIPFRFYVRVVADTQTPCRWRYTGVGSWADPVWCRWPPACRAGPAPTAGWPG